MFAYIKGTVEEKGNNYIVVECNDIGYKIFMSNIAINEIGELGSKVKVHTYYHVREDNISLYGFVTNKDEANKTITVKPIGGNFEEHTWKEKYFKKAEVPEYFKDKTNLR